MNQFVRFTVIVIFPFKIQKDARLNFVVFSCCIRIYCSPLQMHVDISPPFLLNNSGRICCDILSKLATVLPELNS